MRLVLQCAMCGTHHPVGTPVCSTCRATGVTQLRLMFECPKCGSLGIDPVCGACPVIVPLELDDDLIVAEEVTEEAFALEPPPDEDFEDIDLGLDFGEEDSEGSGEEAVEIEAVVVDLSDDEMAALDSHLEDDDDWDDGDPEDEDD